MQETIFALSSGTVPSGIAVIRISGTRVSDIIRMMLPRQPQPRFAEFFTIRDRAGDPIDKGLVLFFPAPHSFTGEDCLELQVHGGHAVVSAVFNSLASIENTRMADPGEFTRRAFANGKIDLVEAEGLADLLSAETEMQRRLALEQAKGGHSLLYHGWAHRITRARAMIEAELDFADEEDVPDSLADRIWLDMTELTKEIDAHLSERKAGEIIRNGLKVVIFGAPNAGKSRLLNRLAQRDVAIVTSSAGTTRDLITVDLEINGYAVRLYDTAGIRQTEELVEIEGIRRAQLAAEEADLILHVIDVTAPGSDQMPPASVKSIRIGNKIDLTSHTENQNYDIVISAESGYGIAELKEAIGSVLSQKVSTATLAIPARFRHVELLTQVRDALKEACELSASVLDIRAEYLRRASNSLGRITGRVDVEDLLSVIFSEFCIGK